MNEVPPSCEAVLPFVQRGWVGVEIGVCQGHSALAFLGHGVRFMFLVDPWDWYDGIEGGEGADPEEFSRGCDGVFRDCRARLAVWDDGRHFAVLRMPSAEAAGYVPEVDFVWIDGNHRYEWVKSDIEMYWPKCRRFICGHDFTNVGSCQVQKAVEEFVQARGLPLVTFPDVSSCWLVRK